jgi:glycosyltransferase involved in cell wall biosynthesis
MSDNPWSGIERAVAPDGTVASDAPLERGEPREEEYAEPYAPPGVAAAASRGVLWQGDYQTLDDGMCRHVRLQSRALYNLGVATRLVSISHGIRIGRRPNHSPLDLPPGYYMAAEDLLDPTVRSVVEPLTRQTIGTPDVVVRQAPYSSAHQLLEQAIPRDARIDPDRAAGLLARTIAYLPWERSVLEPEYAAALSRFGQVWLQSRRHLEIFSRAGVPRERLMWIPNVYDEQSGPALLGQSGKPIPRGKRFYHIGKWEPRKNQHKLLGAFMLAFKPTDEASLFIKTHPFGRWANYPDGEESLGRWLANPLVQAQGWTHANWSSRIRITDVTYSDDELTDVAHARNNIYVSSGAGEAWDYPAFDAKLAGNRLVYVGFGGPEDYAELERDVRVPWTLAPVHPGYPWGNGACWAEYGVSELADALREAEPPAQRAPCAHLQSFSQMAVARQMADAITQLLGTTLPEWLEQGARRG